ncbi:MAG: DsbA family protein [Alphaproteobacteria bacterium]|nr:DsbA family protein [Alphaproteobacteria bacterium]
MPLSRRSVLAVAAGTALAVPGLARAEGGSRTSERSLGRPDAKVTVQEFFSLTCTHCAHFSQVTMPDVRTKLIDTGRIRYVYRDFPLDQVALLAAMVARALPPERFDAFITALFASQDRWAFARDVNTQDELWKIAALAGMDRPTFDSAVKDEPLRAFILQEQAEAQKRWQVDSTPSFTFNDHKEAGAMDFATFEKLVSAAAA